MAKARIGVFLVRIEVLFSLIHEITLQVLRQGSYLDERAEIEGL